MSQLLLFVNLTRGLIDLNYGQEPYYKLFSRLGANCPNESLIATSGKLITTRKSQVSTSLRSLGTLNRHIKLSSSALP
jgi:hypothetical protein